MLVWCMSEKFNNNERKADIENGNLLGSLKMMKIELLA